ncbi:MAG: Gfo/Idh/MocA family protein [Acidobacteriota bacterium]
MKNKRKAQIKVAVIGVGAMGSHHARIYAEMQDVRLVGVADLDRTRAATIARRYGTTGYSDYGTLLDRAKPEAVTVAVPTRHHLPVALEVMQRGIHLLLEKPISYTLEEGQQIAKCSSEAGVQLMIGHVERFNPAIIQLRDRVNSGEAGKVFQMDARRQGPFPARPIDVGVVVDLAVHDLDVIRYVSGQEVIRLYAETERRIHSDNEDLLTGVLRLRDGTVATLTINWLTPRKVRELEVTGELGMFRVNYLTQDLFFFQNGCAEAAKGDWDSMHVFRGVSEGCMIRYAVEKREPLRIEQEAFLNAIRNGTTVPVTGWDALAALRLAHATVISGLEHHDIALGIGDSQITVLQLQSQAQPA